MLDIKVGDWVVCNLTEESAENAYIVWGKSSIKPDHIIGTAKFQVVRVNNNKVLVRIDDEQFRSRRKDRVYKISSWPGTTKDDYASVWKLTKEEQQYRYWHLYNHQVVKKVCSCLVRNSKP